MRNGMNRKINLFRHYPLAVYFILVFIISWGSVALLTAPVPVMATLLILS